MSSQSRGAADREKNSAVTDMELRRRLLSCMAETLTSRQYQVFVLHFLEGMPQKEIAAEFGLSRSAVSKTVNAAKYKLRLALGYTFESPEPEAEWYEDS
ncbi:MAG TPA: sigma-70 family RNA polymerase sigma factor [Candidatus Butyricicoccus stercorigallinarum]|nr:sigma-70 family RNA polymerase sigma factor [Candidatus Butyricicoccus stercorigallinarum]